MTTPTPEARAWAESLKTANGFTVALFEADRQAIALAYDVALTEQAQHAATEIAALKLENERLRAWIADLRRDSLHEKLVAKIAEKDAEIAELKQALHRSREKCDEALHEMRREVERATWEAAAQVADTYTRIAHSPDGPTARAIASALRAAAQGGAHG